MKAILVLGTGRCGSSALTGCLQALGAFCGNNLRDANIDNERGYFEDTNISYMNKYILNVIFKMSWYDASIPLKDIKAVNPWEEIISLIKYAIHLAYGNNPIIAIKDPRICLLLGCYKQALSELGYEIYYVQSQRPIAEKVQSLIKGITTFNEVTGAEIIQHYGDILDHSLSRCISNKPIKVEFNDLIHNTSDTIYSLKYYLPFLSYEEENILKVNRFLDPTLKHF